MSADHLHDQTAAPATPDASALPLATRAGALGARRRKKEVFVRGIGAGKDETATAGFIFGLFIYSIRFTLMALGLYRRGIRNSRKLALVHHDIAVPKLPEALEGFRILHISDFHFPRRFPGFAEAVGKLLDGLQVDLCAVTGDYRYGYFGPADHVAAHLQTALKGVKSRHGVYAVLGNHDHFATGELLEESGVSVLFNEGRRLQQNGCSLWVCGIDDPNYYQCDDLDTALYERPEDTFTILLVHTPERIVPAAEKGVALYLAGHTHGGQIRLPLLGAIVSNARCRRDQVWGPWRYEEMVGHTTSGIGATDVPVRYNCPPEAVVLTLRRDLSGS
jgi:uncharacterized protein